MEIITTIEQLEALESEIAQGTCHCSTYDLVASLRAAFEREAKERAGRIELCDYINGPCKDAVMEAFK